MCTRGVAAWTCLDACRCHCKVHIAKTLQERNGSCFPPRQCTSHLPACPDCPPDCYLPSPLRCPATLVSPQSCTLVMASCRPVTLDFGIFGYVTEPGPVYDPETNEWVKYEVR